MAALLRRYTGTDDMLVGRPGEPGQLAGMLPLRVRCAAESSYRDLVGQLRTAVPEAARHADYPVELLAEELAADAGPGPHPLVDVAVGAAPRTAPGSGCSSPSAPPR